MDSGATDHITHDPKQLDEVNGKNCGKTRLVMGNGNKIVVFKYKNTSISCEKSIIMKDILYAPQIEKTY